MHCSPNPIFFLWIFGGIAKESDISGKVEATFDCDNDFSEKWIGDIGNDQSNRMRSLGAQVSGGAVINVAEHAHTVLDGAAGISCDGGHITEDERNGGARDAGVLGNVVERDSRLGGRSCGAGGHYKKSI